MSSTIRPAFRRAGHPEAGEVKSAEAVFNLNQSSLLEPFKSLGQESSPSHAPFGAFCAKVGLDRISFVSSQFCEFALGVTPVWRRIGASSISQGKASAVGSSSQNAHSQHCARCPGRREPRAVKLIAKYDTNGDEISAKDGSWKASWILLMHWTMNHYALERSLLILADERVREKNTPARMPALPRYGMTHKKVENIC